MNKQLIQLLIDIKNLLLLDYGKFQSLIQRITQQLQQLLPTQPPLTLVDQARLLDFFILDYNYDQNRYQIYGQCDGAQQGSRQAIKSLMFSTIRDHIKLKQRTKSMTQLHQLTSNPSIVSNPIILPYFQQNLQRYTYIYQSQECISVHNTYYTYYRYYCFVSNNKVHSSLNQTIKKIRSKTFEKRLLQFDNVENVEYQRLKHNFQSNLGSIIQIVRQTILIPEKQTDYRTANYKISIYKQSLFDHFKDSKISILIIIVVMWVKQYKVILLTINQNKHYLSQIIMDFLACLDPIKYCYPIIQTTLTQQHCQYFNSPMPLLIGIWGSQKYYLRIKQLFNKQERSKQNLEKYRLILDVTQMKIVSKLSAEDCFLMENLTKHLQKYQQQINLIKKIKLFIKIKLINQINCQNDPQWILIMRKYLKKSLMYDDLVNKKNHIRGQKY